MKSLSSLMAAYIKHCRNERRLSMHSLRAYQQDIRDFAGFLPRRPAGAAPGPAEMRAYISNLAGKRGLGPATVKRRLACLKTFFAWAKRNAEVPGSPFEGLEISSKLPRRLPRALARADVERLVAVLRATMEPRAHLAKRGEIDTRDSRTTTYLAVLLMISTGVRVSELIGIRLTDVRPQEGIIRINGKGNRERTVYVANPGVRAFLSRYGEMRNANPTPCDRLLMNTRGARLTDQALRVRLKQAAEAAGISRAVTPHMLRHTAATLLLDEGADIRHVQKLLGHSSISTTEIYTHVSDQSLIKALDRADPIRGVRL
ncbi:tyrosine-type recombinase/integrase [Dongia sedimenti]|uniref:Tyrosine-type recombinase/integrase n=1 Tax=Dongia sedimenti TaxID=3064282 RepID=A0ABU0YTB7_9PROT|nr:tyrosine-type recombinase/integrase [Rhodospirillaceae bacterium R-7]